MASRLWTNPPLKADGTLDYSRLTVAEVCEDLTDSLVDRVFNSGLEALEPFLDELPDEYELPPLTPTDALVRFMEDLLRFEGDDPDFRSSAAREAVRGAVGELRNAARRRAEPDAPADGERDLGL